MEKILTKKHKEYWLNYWCSTYSSQGTILVINLDKEHSEVKCTHLPYTQIGEHSEVKNNQLLSTQIDNYKIKGLQRSLKNSKFTRK